MTFTVTATQQTATDGGMTATLECLSGQSASPIGATVAAAALSASITPAGTGSLIFGSLLATHVNGSVTPLSGTTILGDTSIGGLEYASLESVGTTTAGTPVTIGVTSTGSPLDLALLEVKTSGTLYPFVGSPGFLSSSGATSITTNPISPPAGSLLVLMVSSNGSAGNTTISVSDTSGLGLTWTERVKLNPSGNGYAGIWTAVVPSTAPTTIFGQLDPVLGVSADTSHYSMGMQFSLSQATPLTGIWFYSGSGAAILPDGCVIYQITAPNTGSIVTGTLNSSPSWSGAAGSGWVKCSYPGTVTLASGTAYKVVIYNQGGADLYSSTSNYWDSVGPGTSGLTSGVMSAPNNATGDGGQDSFNTAAGWPNYPASAFSASNYWIDVEVTAGGSPPVTPTGLLLGMFP